ncbi:CopG family transcriptional regulator [Paenibacillus sp. HJGM_3]|uniref:ribbon-helix-helix domain-containing protein n=1 Tax=Paenibacillus sp. HJGM_3 TaxID=3379816 RepID=UPI00385C1CCB
MIRKQIYLSEEMNRRLNEISRQRGVPQSEVIREGLEQYITESVKKDELWEELLSEMKKAPPMDLKWNRDEQYAERTEKYGGPHERSN